MQGERLCIRAHLSASGQSPEQIPSLGLELVSGLQHYAGVCHLAGVAHVPSFCLTGFALQAAVRTVSGCPQMGNALQGTGQLITVDADCPGMGEPEEAPKNPLQAKRRRRAPTKVKRLQDIGIHSRECPASGDVSEGSQSAGGKRKAAGADTDSAAWMPAGAEVPAAEAAKKKVHSPPTCNPDLAL